MYDLTYSIYHKKQKKESKSFIIFYLLIKIRIKFNFYKNHNSIYIYGKVEKTNNLK